MSNQLAGEISQYLLQHAENPVQWHAWNAEALELARARQAPIFLSIGYSSCHWCHVMAHESFEDRRIADLLNEHFVSIKVDREERPDLDQIYMEAVQLMTGQGGWPLSVFLTPEGQPFFGGTYWPAQKRYNMPGFDLILQAVAEAWEKRRGELVDQAAKVTGILRENNFAEHAAGPLELDERILEAAEAVLVQSFDPQYGGFGPAPKFPQPLVLNLLLSRWTHAADDELLHVVTTTLDRMAMGGINDQLGGGFHRYSVDARWIVPHFEKMLYDNALLSTCYLKAWQAANNQSALRAPTEGWSGEGQGEGVSSHYADAARETLDYVLRDMTAPQGGFYSAEDADSEGQEGKFYVWTMDQIQDVLGLETAATFSRVYDVSETGNFEGQNILYLSRPIELEAKMLGRDAAELKNELTEARKKLFAAREKRLRPARDEKIMVAWNGLMIDALAQAGAVLGEKRFSEAAAKAASFLLTRLRAEPGRLMHCARNGQVKYNAYLDDYAALGNALVTLHETNAGGPWLQPAVELAEELLRRFADPEQGGFFYTPADHEPLIARKKDFIDGSVPSGNGLAAMLLLRLARICSREDYRKTAYDTLRAGAAFMRQFPSGTCQMLTALDTYYSTM
ncbi:MAG: thioredoxin domain-containing protein [Thermoguttaceae bacterium]|jgi:uncharacterized protein YyaL (SSP411 family)